MTLTLDRRARRIRPDCRIDNLGNRAMTGQAGCKLVDRDEVPTAESTSRTRATQ